MRVLIVCSYKNQYKSHITPFIEEQGYALQSIAKVEVDYFLINGKGILGYLRLLPKLKLKIKEFNPNIIHAHYGLSGVLANLQRKVPVVTTYHGSDINNPEIRRFSKIAIRLSAWNIFVSQKNIQLSGVEKRFSLIPCGVDTSVFKPMDKAICRQKFGFDPDEKLILFAGAFDNKVKNPELAMEAVAKIPDARLLELKGYNRTQVAELMNAVDVCLMTSHTEGSPQFVKEAMACNCPVVSVNVGDVEELLQGVEHCEIVERETDEIAKSVSELLNLNQRSSGSEKLKYSGLESLYVVDKIKSLYQNIIENA